MGWTPQRGVAAAVGAAAEARQSRLRRRFRAVSRRAERVVRPRRARGGIALPALAVVGVLVLCLVAVARSPWPAAVTIKHYTALTGCDAAYLVGLAPARAGSPGYWRRLDLDRDGRSCEIRPGLYRHNTLVRWYFWH